MNNKIGAFLISAIALFALLTSACIVFAQPYDWCIVVAYGTDLVVDETNGFFSFTAYPDMAPDMANWIVATEVGGDPVEINLSTGDEVVVSYHDFVDSDLIRTEDPHAPGYYRMWYQDLADSVTMNSVEIPEFPMFLILPIFMTATLLTALFFRRKHSA